MSRPLDFIKELADLPYKVTTKPLFYANGRIRSVSGKIFDRKSLIAFVNAAYQNLYVMDCVLIEGEAMQKSFGDHAKKSTTGRYRIRYCVVDQSKHSSFRPFIEK